MADLYDEFGNYLGPDVEEDGQDEVQKDIQEDGQEEGEEERRDVSVWEGMDTDEGEEGGGEGQEEERQIVLAEDKKDYPDAEEVYGEDVEVLVMDEDEKNIEEPIIQPKTTKKFQVLEKGALRAHANVEFMNGLMAQPELVRNVAVIGHLQHGKTQVMDMLVEQTHVTRHQERQNDKPMRFTDARIDEQERGISIKTTPMSLVMESSTGKHFLCNLLDTPGHPNFSDEMSAALRLADGALLVVDACEGVMLNTERAIRHAAIEGVRIGLVISKVDRLVTELRIPPADAYFKLHHIVQEVNAIILASNGGDESMEVSPVDGSVVFSSALHGWSFSLHTFAQLYVEVHGMEVDPKAFAKRLWGEFFFEENTSVFRKRTAGENRERSFVQFVLEPLYKIYSTILGENSKVVGHMLDEFGVYIKPSEFNLDPKPLIKLICKKVFGTATGITDLMVHHFPSSVEGTRKKVEMLYTGPTDCPFAKEVSSCSANGPLVLLVAKLFPDKDCKAFGVFGRVLSGSVCVGDSIRILGDSYTPDDEEDSYIQQVTEVSMFQSRYKIPFKTMQAGSLVLLGGLDDPINKSATLVSEGFQEEVFIFKPLTFNTKSVMKIAVEPLNPSELPKMVEGLRKINKSYPLAVTKVEESGEHTITGTGELYLDSVMKDLREMYADMEVKVADPVTSFSETVVETSAFKCFADTPNKQNRITMIAEPLEKGLSNDVETGRVSLNMPPKEFRHFLQSNYEWDALAARSVWAFGPDVNGPNVLLDDTIPGEVDKTLMKAIQQSVVQGFQWGSREGPLCEEPMQNVKFRILDATIADKPLLRGGGQVIPTVRRVTYSSFLTASPRLMEPMYLAEIQAPGDCLSAIYNILSKRRGHVTKDAPKPGTPFYVIHALLPVIESWGFETDLRYHTQGQAFCLTVFDHWSIVPGDPLDRSIKLVPLAPSPPPHLAREFMVKTRRRKGMADDVSLAKFFDDPVLLELARGDPELQQLL